VKLSRLILGGAVVASGLAVSAAHEATASAHPAGTACHASLSFTADTASVSLSPTGCTHAYELTSWSTVAEGNNKGETMLQRVTSPPWIVSLPQGGCPYQVDFRDTTNGRLLAGEQGGVTCQPVSPPTTSLSTPTSTTMPAKTPDTSPSTAPPAHTVTPISTTPVPMTITPTKTQPMHTSSTSSPTAVPEAPEAPIVRNCGCTTG
jgi:hypothetical protein